MTAEPVQETHDWRHQESHASEPAGTADVQLRESGELDARVIESGDGHVVEVTLIRSGTSKMGNHYPPEVLTEAAPLFEGAPAFADHQKRPDLPEGSIKDIVGHYRQVRPVSEGGAVALKGELHLLPTAEWLFHLLRTAESNPRICGISIDAWADRDPALSTRESQHIRRILRVNSADIVTRPSAGGGIRRVLQSEVPTMPDTQVLPQTAQTPPVGASSAAPASAAAHADETATRRADGTAPDLDRLREALSGPDETKPWSLDTLVRFVTTVQRERDLAQQQLELERKLQEAALPAPVEAKLRRQFSGRVCEAAEIESALAEERAMLAALTQEGTIRGMGVPKGVEMGLSEYERVQAAMDGLFDVAESDAARSVPPLSGIREAFLVATGRDIAMLGGANAPLRESIAQGMRDYVNRGRLTESETLLREADVTTASFSALLGTSMNVRLPGPRISRSSELVPSAP